MLPMTRYILQLTKTDDIAKAEQVLVSILVMHHDAARAQNLAAHLLSTGYLPVYFMTEMPAWLGVSEAEFGDVYRSHMLFLRNNHPELFSVSEASEQGASKFARYSRMSPDKENLFYTTFPELFRGRSKTKEESLMCYGIDCPEKWFDLLWQHCIDLEKSAMVEGRERGTNEWPEIIQIKEKLGTLRCYVRNESDFMRELRDQLLLASVESEKSQL